jgi:hypothetical protein
MVSNFQENGTFNTEIITIIEKPRIQKSNICGREKGKTQT